MGYVTKGQDEGTTLNKTKLFIYLVLGVSCLAVAIWTVFVDPMIVFAKYYCRVDNGTIIHEVLTKEVDSVHLSAYLFNITNADRFASGLDDKLKMQEVGPFTYQENRTNDDLEIDKEAGVLRVTPHHKVAFLPEESVSRPEETIVTVANMAMLSIASLATNFGILGKMGFNMLASQLRSNATVTMSVHDYLWGYKEPLIQMGNSYLPGLISFDKLGLLDRLYDESIPLRLEVSIRDEDKFMIKSVNGIGGLPMWGYPETISGCNSFKDTFEGFAYPQGMPPDRPLKIYRNVLCRFMELDYVGQKTMEFGVEGMAYKFSNRSYSKIPENECLCGKGLCFNGVSDLSPCMYGLPMALSNAHFLDADPRVYERIEGMTPNEEQHGSSFIVDPIMGIVMSTKFSVQVNIVVRDVKYNSKANKYSNMFVPIAYFKIVQPKLPDEPIAALRLFHIYRPYIVLSFQLVLTLIALLFLALSARLWYGNWISARRKETDFNTEKIDAKEILSSKPLMER